MQGQAIYTIYAVDTHLDPIRMEVVDPIFVANGIVNGEMGVVTDIT